MVPPNPPPPPAFPQTPAPPPPSAPASSPNTGASPKNAGNATQAPAGNADGDADTNPAEQPGSPSQNHTTEEKREQGQVGVAAGEPAPSAASDAERRAGAAPTRTATEREAALEREFENSLASFDGRLSRERQRLEEAAARERMAANEAAESGSREPGDETSSAAGAGTIPDLDPAQTRETARDRQTSSGAPPSDAPGGQNDDIVARQIREAAESETDPALREKLWEEYRKYKQQNQT